MPIAKKMVFNDGEPDIVLWRYWCECLTPTHVLELVEEGDSLELGICIEPKGGLWCRIKVAWNILRGREARYTEIILAKEDREELASVIKGMPA